MNAKTKFLLSALIAAVIAAGGATIGVLQELGADKDIGEVRIATWIVIAVTGLIAAGKDLKTYLAEAPKDTT